MSQRLGIALAASLPFALLQLVFIGDPLNWQILLFAYGMIALMAPLIFVTWCVYCFAEYRLRLEYGIRPTPSFALAGGTLLLAFILPAGFVSPILQTIPSFCRVTQSIEWSTSKPHEEWNAYQGFVLVLIGRGTKEDHCFTTGYMNWTGREPAGFTSIEFSPVTFQEQYYAPRIPGSYEYLKARMATSGIPDDELKTISKDVWQIVSHVNEGLEIRPSTGTASTLISHIDDQWDFVIGGWIWILALVSVFSLVGCRSLRVENPTQATG